jgi:hypothetical protein
MKFGARNARQFAIVAERKFAPSPKFGHENKSYASADKRQ